MAPGRSTWRVPSWLTILGECVDHGDGCRRNTATADASHSYTVDTVAEATIAIDSVTADNVVNAAESGNTVTITGSVGGDAKEGDTVTVYVGNQEFTAQVAADKTWSVESMAPSWLAIRRLVLGGFERCSWPTRQQQMPRMSME